MKSPRPPLTYGAAATPALPKLAGPSLPGSHAGGLMGAARTMPQMPKPVKPVTARMAGVGMVKRKRTGL